MCVWSLAFDDEATVIGLGSELIEMSGRLVSGSSDGSIHVWDLETSSSIFGPLRRHKGTVWCVDVSHSSILVHQNIIRRSLDTYIVSGGQDHVVNVWSANTGEIKQTFRTHTSAVRSVQFSPHYGAVASASTDGTIRVHRIHAMMNDIETYAKDTLVTMDRFEELTLIWEKYVTHSIRHLNGCPYRASPYHVSAVTCMRFGRRMCPIVQEADTKTLGFAPVLISTALSGEIWVCELHILIITPPLSLHTCVHTTQVHSIPLSVDTENMVIQSDKHIAVDSDDQIQHHRGSVTCCDVIHMDVCKLDDEDSCCGAVILIVTAGVD